MGKRDKSFRHEINKINLHTKTNMKNNGKIGKTGLMNGWNLADIWYEIRFIQWEFASDKR